MAPKDAKRSEPREFVVVAFPDHVDKGATLRLLGVAATQAQAEKLIDGLDSGTLGRIAVLERKSLFVRRTAVETVAIIEAIAEG